MHTRFDDVGCGGAKQREVVAAAHTLSRWWLQPVPGKLRVATIGDLGLGFAPISDIAASGFQRFSSTCSPFALEL